MTDEDESVEWTDAERRALAALEGEEAPPPGTEDRLVRELALRGRRAILARRTASFGRLLLGLAAASALFAAGVVVGGRTNPPAGRTQASDEPRFALFLLDEPPGGKSEEAERVAEYKRWAASQPSGRVVSGEKLGDDARLLVPGGALPASGDSGAVRGYFVIRAPDLAAAVDVARSCPHLVRGGRILIRPIVPV